MDEVLIIGGGFAGLGTGVALAGVGRRARLLEQKPHLGGRARSFVDSTTGSVVDNGQHIFMGCYHATLRFLETIGTLGCVRFQPRLALHFLDKNQGLTTLDCPNLPSPWNLFLGVVRSRSFSLSERFQVLRLARQLSSLPEMRNAAPLQAAASSLPTVGEGFALPRAGGARPYQRDDGHAAGRTVTEWLGQLGQSENLQRNFWDLLCLAAMNEDPRIASPVLFARVLRLALFTSPEDSRLGRAGVGLSECYTRAATAYIQARGGSVECGRSVSRLLVSDGVCRGIELSGGEKIEAATVVAAVPWHQLAALLPGELFRSQPFFAGLLTLRPAPIISINLWFDAPVTDLELIGLRGTIIQWLFNKGKILGSGENYVSLVLSGAHRHIGRSKEELLQIALRDLSGLLPPARKARLLHSLVIKERFATFSPSWDAEQVRPPALTPVLGLYLAGDWTATGLPATIEGAVQSGYAAAEAILRGA